MESSETAVLQTAVTRWLKSVPLYRRPGLECFDSPSRFFFCFQQLPTIDKGDIRRGFPRNFVASEAELDRLVDAGLVELERTSGTSEAPTPLLLPLGWWNRQEETALRLNPQVGDLLRPGFRRVTPEFTLLQRGYLLHRHPTTVRTHPGNQSVREFEPASVPLD